MLGLPFESTAATGRVVTVGLAHVFPILELRVTVRRDVHLSCFPESELVRFWRIVP
jgi:hypothetical protein